MFQALGLEVNRNGKSTLMNILGALDQPSAGRCFVGDLDLLRLTPAQRVRYQREGVWFVWQNSARNLIPYLTGLQNVLLPMRLAGRSGRDARAWALELWSRSVWLTGPATP